MLRFDEEKHAYYWNDKKVPSVSEILQKVGLCKDYTGISPFYAERGAATHLAIKYFLKGTLDEDSLDPVVRPHFEAFRAYWSKHRHKPIQIEEPLYDENWKYAGTPDLVCEDMIIDWKCSKNHDRVAELQGEGYKVLVGPPIRFRVVQLMDSGNYEVFDYGEKIEYWESIWKLYHWKVKRKE